MGAEAVAEGWRRGRGVPDQGGEPQPVRTLPSKNGFHSFKRL